MKSYDHIVEFVNRQAWAILPETLAIIKDILTLRVQGLTLTKDEIQARIGESKKNEPQFGGPVAVLPLRGVISHRMGMLSESSGGTSTERFTKNLRQVVGDPSVGSIVIDMDSPGGTVSGVEELATEILKAREQKHIVAVANATMASAAYWIGSAASEVVATPSGRVGSIGVFTMHVDESKALEDAGLNVTLVSAGKYKTDENPFGPLSDEVRQSMQDRVDAVYDRFVKGVAKGRGVSVATVRSDYGQGKLLDAQQAKGAGMIDRVATLDDTIARMSKGNRRSASEAAVADGNSTFSVTIERAEQPVAWTATASGNIKTTDETREKPLPENDVSREHEKQREKESIEAENEREEWRNRVVRR